MESPPLATFHPGYFPKRNRRQQREMERARAHERARAAAKAATRQHGKTPVPPTPFKWPTPPPQKWLILPTPGAEPFFLARTGVSSLTDAMKECKRLSVAWAKLSNPLLSIPPAYIARLTALAVQNQRTRYQMRRLLTAWLRRRFRQVNDTDLVTLEPPRDPIRIVDWANRCTYTFEARTILGDLRQRILCHDQLFPTPSPPRNPYTNSLLTYGQQFFLTQELTRRGMAEWWLLALAATEFIFTRFEITQRMALRSVALRDLFRNPKDPDLADLVVDFIESEHMNHGQENRFSYALYMWALQHETSHPTIKRWIALCRDYYEAEFKYATVKQIDEVRDRVFDDSAALCGPNHELVILRARWRRAQGQPQRAEP